MGDDEEPKESGLVHHSLMAPSPLARMPVSVLGRRVNTLGLEPQFESLTAHRHNEQPRSRLRRASGVGFVRATE